MDQGVGSAGPSGFVDGNASGARAYAVLSLFSGCGGMDLGFEGGFDVPAECVNAALHPDWIERDHGNGWVRLRPTGFRTVLACDIRESVRRIWVRNFSRRGHSPEEFILRSVVDLVKAHRRGEFTFPEAEVVIGGFSCQDFSTAGKRAGFRSGVDHLGRPMAPDIPAEECRGMLYYWMREVVSIVRPLVFVAENVDGLRSMGDALSTISSDFASIGYTVVSPRTLYAPDHGVPQTRKRIIFIGLRSDAVVGGIADPYPAPTHGDPVIAGDGRRPRVTAGTALRGLPEPADSDDPSQRSPSNAKYLPGGYQGQIEVPLGRPGPTIRANHHGHIEFRRLSIEHGGRHADELAAGLPERRLTVRECARIQTFPDDFELVVEGARNERVPKSAAYLGVGNAVPPLLAYCIAMRLLEVWPVAFGSGSGHEAKAGGASGGGGGLDARTGTYAVLSLFSGCGGMDLGFEQAGFTIVGANEWNEEHPAIAKTYEANHPGTKLVNADITLKETKDSICNLFTGTHCDVVIGGPPCVASSMSGRRDPNDPRGWLFMDYLEIVDRLRPAVVVLENVPGILSCRPGEQVPVVERIIAGLESLGYHLELEPHVLNSANYGVPQCRKRVIILATRLDVAIRYPAPTHAKAASPSGETIPWVSVRDALHDLEDAPEDEEFRHVHVRSSPEFVERMRRTPPGKSASIGYREVFQKLWADRPSVTVKGNNGGLPIHYSRDRLITPREMARLQDFPDSFRFLGTKSDVLLMVGNAVPVGLARAVATSVMEMLDEAARRNQASLAAFDQASGRTAAATGFATAA